MARLSGLQREVLALYRNCLRESRKKPQVRANDIVSGSSQLTLRYRLPVHILRALPGELPPTQQNDFSVIDALISTIEMSFIETWP
jgi:hypothetical protein